MTKSLSCPRTGLAATHQLRDTPMRFVCCTHCRRVVWCPGFIAPDVRPSHRQHANKATPGPEKAGTCGARHHLLCHDPRQGAQLGRVPHLTCAPFTPSCFHSLLHSCTLPFIKCCKPALIQVYVCIQPVTHISMCLT